MKFRRLSAIILPACCMIATGVAANDQDPKPDPGRDKAAYEQAAAGDWQEVFSDPCTGDWRHGGQWAICQGPWKLVRSLDRRDNDADSKMMKPLNRPAQEPCH